MKSYILTRVGLRKAVVALAFVGMLLAAIGVNNVDGASSPVSIASDKSSSDIMVGETVTVTLTLTNSDKNFAQMDVYMVANWQSGTTWSYAFKNSGGSALTNNLIQLDKEGSNTVLLTITCDGACATDIGTPNTVQVYGKTDPVFYNPGVSTNTATCGSTDCVTDTSPASQSGNLTNQLSITLTSRTPYGSTLACDDNSSSGDNQFYQAQTYFWDYTVTNTGWNSDTYKFTVSVVSQSGGVTQYWTTDTGLADGKPLTGKSDSSSTAVHSAESSMKLIPALDTRPDVYTVTFTTTSVTDSTSVSTCSFNIVVPEPDLEIKDTDISFSHTGAWINTRGDSQRVTIYAKERNNGGTADVTGVETKDIEVRFYVDGSQAGAAQAVPSLGHGEEAKVQIYWNPARSHDEDEVGIPIRVMIDPQDVIQETETDNNEASVFFKVVRTKASNPSFYMSFLALSGAVGAAVLLSSYYRNKEDLEE